MTLQELLLSYRDAVLNCEQTNSVLADLKEQPVVFNKSPIHTADQLQMVIDYKEKVSDIYKEITATEEEIIEYHDKIIDTLDEIGCDSTIRIKADAGDGFAIDFWLDDQNAINFGNPYVD